MRSDSREARLAEPMRSDSREARLAEPMRSDSREARFDVEPMRLGYLIVEWLNVGACAPRKKMPG